MSEGIATLPPIPPILEFIRTHPKMYAALGTHSAALALMLQSDALGFGARHTQIDVVSGWYLVSADLDWLAPPVLLGVTVEDLFRRLVPAPQLGPNSCRVDVVVAAFARAGVTGTPGQVTRVFGDELAPREVVEALCPPGCGRTVAFVANGS